MWGLLPFAMALLLSGSSQGFSPDFNLYPKLSLKLLPCASRQSSPFQMPLLEAVRYRFSCSMVLIVLVAPYADTPELLMLWRVTLGIIPASFSLLESSCLSLTPQCHRLAGTTSSTLWWPCYTGFPLRNILYSHM